jgi:tetratricopeptide (TPR) repeat protein
MSGDQQVFQNAINQGHSAAWDLEWEKAASYYHVAVDEFPENVTALSSLALALYETHKYPEALEYYQRVTKISTTDPVPMLKVAEINERMGNLSGATKANMDVADLFARNREIEKAIQSWKRVVALNPEHMTAHTRLALVYERLGRTSEAMVEFISIASLLQIKGDMPNAVQTMKHALQVVPNSKEANQALTMLLNGNPIPMPERARGGTGPLLMSQASQADSPISVEEIHPRIDPIQDAKQKALTMLADILFEQEEIQGQQSRKGISSIIKGKEIEGQDQFDQTKVILHLSQAIDYQTHGDDGHAVSELEHAINSGLENSAAYFDLGFMQSKNEQFEKAVQNLKKCIQHEEFSFGSRLLLALTFYKMDLINEASNEYLEALRIADAQCVAPDQAEELIQLYEPLIESFNQQADQKLQKRICENISKMLIRPDWKEQTQLARQQLPSQPSGSTPTPLAEMLTEATSSQLIESLSKVNQFARANKVLSAMEEAFYALKFAPFYLPLHVCIGDLLVQENHLPEAVLKYSIIAKSYNLRGETNRAISLLRRVSELTPMDLESRNTLIDLLSARGKISETIQEYIKLAETYYSIADLVSARKTYAQGFHYAQQSNVDRQTKIKLMHRLADIDMQSLDLRNAIRVLEQIRTLNPEDSKARDMLFDLNLRLGQSNQAMTELDNYLNHLISLNRSTEALEYLNIKIRENQNQPELYQHLAELYRLMGRTEDAINQLEIAKEIYIQAENNASAILTIKAILALNPTNSAIYQRMLVELQAEK